MARRGHGFWGALLGPPPPPVERFSLESLRGLHDVLQRNAVVTDVNRDTVVEALRSIAELMIWGDQHDGRFFDYFAENNLLAHFTAFLQQRSNRQGDVAKQVLQTLSILIQNIRSTTAIFYLFSNNHVNEIVALRFDFDDDEVRQPRRRAPPAPAAGCLASKRADTRGAGGAGAGLLHQPAEDCVAEAQQLHSTVLLPGRRRARRIPALHRGRQIHQPPRRHGAPPGRSLHPPGQR